MIEVILSEQDLGDFFKGNGDAMLSYQSELEKRLTEHFGSAIVEISSNHRMNKFEVENDMDEDVIREIMNRMVNDWSWLTTPA